MHYYIQPHKDRKSIIIEEIWLRYPLLFFKTYNASETAFKSLNFQNARAKYRI